MCQNANEGLQNMLLTDKPARPTTDESALNEAEVNHKRNPAQEQ